MYDLVRRGVCCLSISVGMQFADRPAHAQENPSAVEDRMAAVESGLIPSLRIEGQTASANITVRMEHYRVPGVSIAVIHSGRLDWAKGYGYADVESESPVTTETLFQAASVSKPVAAIATLRLVDRGDLDLDEPVNNRLSSWQLPDNDFTAEVPVTLRRILSHTAGLTIHGFPGYAVDDRLPTVPQILDGAEPANTDAVRVDILPGTQFRYSGGGTTIQQLVLMDVTGKPFHELMREEVLAPLGMNQSTYSQPLSAENAAYAASGHDVEGNAVHGKWHVYPEQAAAGLWTNPRELSKYILEVQAAYDGRSERLLSQTMAREMLTPQSPSSVGLGPFLDGQGDARRFGHTGGNHGFKCAFVGFVASGEGAVVMTNADNGWQLTREILNGIAATYGWPDYIPAAKTVVQLSQETIAKYVGEYFAGPLRVGTISADDGRLFAANPTGQSVEIHFESETEFFSLDGGLRGKIVSDESEAPELVVQLGGNEIRAKKKIDSDQN